MIIGNQTEYLNGNYKNMVFYSWIFENNDQLLYVDYFCCLQCIYNVLIFVLVVVIYV